jgi:hypothetical protein
MNVLSHERALAFFPQTTLGQRQNILFNQNLKTLHGHSLGEGKKWESCSAPDASVVLQPRSEFYVATSCRFPGDEYCYTINLPYFGSRVKQPDYLDSNSFSTRFYPLHNKIEYTLGYFGGILLPYVFQKKEAATILVGLKRYSKQLDEGDLSYVLVSFSSAF